MNSNENLTFSDHLHIEKNKPHFATDFKPHCNIIIERHNDKGELAERRDLHNTITTAGLASIMDQLLLSPTLGKPTHMAQGTGSPAATLLGTENARVAFATKTRSAAVVTITAVFPAGTGTGTITEAGLFDIVTANTVNMLASASFTGIPKAAGDSLTFTWTITGA